VPTAVPEIAHPAKNLRLVIIKTAVDQIVCWLIALIAELARRGREEQRSHHLVVWMKVQVNDS
jgi:hypothetical protein